jgi:hypothetical protein
MALTAASIRPGQGWPLWGRLEREYRDNVRSDFQAGERDTKHRHTMKSAFSRRSLLARGGIVLGAVVLLVMSGFAGYGTVQGMPGATNTEESGMRLIVNANGQRIVFALNDSKASMDLQRQLPLTLAVENYGGNEKIFYPPEKLDTANTPPARDVQPGTLAYYAPWGDVVMFYGPASPAAGLYELGHALEGGELIRMLSGTILLEK